MVRLQKSPTGKNEYYLFIEAYPVYEENSPKKVILTKHNFFYDISFPYEEDIKKMQKVVVKYSIVFLLLMVYINRGLFVAMPGIETSCSSGMEINSLLEIILNLAGGENHIDEDGDTPETYNAGNMAHPLIDQSLTCACLMCPYSAVRKIFYTRNDAMLPSDTYKTIDQPPETIEN